MFGLNRITADPNILGGKACIRGMRLSVALIVNLVANGMTTSEIIADYPDLEPEDIQQALPICTGPLSWRESAGSRNPMPLQKILS